MKKTKLTRAEALAVLAVGGTVWVPRKYFNEQKCDIHVDWYQGGLDTYERDGRTLKYVAMRYNEPEFVEKHKEYCKCAFGEVVPAHWRTFYVIGGEKQ